LNARIGETGVPAGLLARLWGAAAIGAAAGWALKPMVAARGSVVSAAVVLGVYGVVYFAGTFVMRVEEFENMVRRAMRFLR